MESPTLAPNVPGRDVAEGETGTDGAPSFIRDMWYVAAWSDELGADKPIGRRIIEEPIVLYRAPDGCVVALQDRCAHRHVQLSLGRIEDDRLRCVYHGLQYGRDGRCTNIPGSDVVPPNTGVRSFPAVERGRWIWVWMGAADDADEASLPDVFDLDSPEWLVNADALEYDAHYQLVHDNLCDLSHLDFVHETTLGMASGSKWANDHPRIVTIDGGIRIERWFVDQIDMSDPQQRLIDTWNEYRFVLPGLFLMETKMFPRETAKACGFASPGPDRQPLMHRRDQQAVTPIDLRHSRYLYATAIEQQGATPELLRGLMGIATAAFAEDKWIIEAQQRSLDLTPPGTPMAFLPQDKALSIFRRTIERRIAPCHLPEHAPAASCAISTLSSDHHGPDRKRVLRAALPIQP